MRCNTTFLKHLKPLQWVLLSLIWFTTAAYGAEKSYLETEGEAAKAIAAIVKSAGHSSDILSIDITAKKVDILMQGTSARHSVNKWSYGRKILGVSLGVSGPEAIKNTGPVADVTTGFFNLRDVPIDRIGETLKEALKFAHIKEDAQVKSLTIKRRLAIVPQITYGDVRWTINIESPRESASVTTSIAGEIIGADLSRTLRAKLMDARRDDWVLPLVARKLKPFVGTKAIVWKLSFSRTTATVTIDSPVDTTKTREYSWRLGKVTQGFLDILNTYDSIKRASGFSIPRPKSRFNRLRVPFRFQDIDFSVLPELKLKAKQVLKLPGGYISGIEAYQTYDMAKIEWRIEITESNGYRKGEAAFDLAGTLMEIEAASSSLNSTDSRVAQWARDIAKKRFEDPADKHKFFLVKNGVLVPTENPMAEADRLMYRGFGDADFKAKKYKEAMSWYTKGAQKTGDPYYEAKIGWMHQQGLGVPRDPKKAYNLYLKAAEKGDGWSMHALGAIYWEGNGVAKDAQKAFQWYLKSALGDYAQSMYITALLYSAGKGIEKNDQTSFQWMKKAAENGMVDAMHHVGAYYSAGTGTARNEAAALGWFRKAATKGHADSMHNIAYMYSKGQGVGQDNKKAVEFIIKALKARGAFTFTQMTKDWKTWGLPFRIEFQQQLKRAGLYRSATTGAYNPETLAAIKKLSGKS